MWFEKIIMTLIILLVLGAVTSIVVTGVKRKDANAAPEKDYYTINRGNIVYEIDAKHQLCFAHHRNNLHLIQIQCIESLLKNVRE